LAARWASFRDAEIAGAGVIDGPPAAAARLQTELGLPFPVLADAQGGVRRAFVALLRPHVPQMPPVASGAFLVLLDRYAAPQAAWLPESGELDDAAWPDHALAEFTAADRACPV
jgi:hypothetical protein